MSDHSARPRVESVATFFLEIEQLSLPSCPQYDVGDYTPTFTVIGEGGGGSVVLDQAATVSEEDGTSYCLALLVTGFPEIGPGNIFLSSVTDDGPGVVPEYLRVGGPNCFNDEWRIVNLDDQVNSMAYRSLISEMPIGTTITYDDGLAGSVAVAVLVANAAPDTSEHIIGPQELNYVGESEIPDFFGEGGIVFTAEIQSDAADFSCPDGDDGLGPDGNGLDVWPPVEGSLVLSETVQVDCTQKKWVEFAWQDEQGHVPPFPFPHCDSWETFYSNRAKWFVLPVAGPHDLGTPVVTASMPAHGNAKIIHSVAWRAQGEGVNPD